MWQRGSAGDGRCQCRLPVHVDTLALRLARSTVYPCRPALQHVAGIKGGLSERDGIAATLHEFEEPASDMVGRSGSVEAGADEAVQQLIRCEESAEGGERGQDGRRAGVWGVAGGALLAALSGGEPGAAEPGGSRKSRSLVMHEGERKSGVVKGKAWARRVEMRVKSSLSERF